MDDQRTAEIRPFRGKPQSDRSTEGIPNDVGRREVKMFNKRLSIRGIIEYATLTLGRLALANTKTLLREHLRLYEAECEEADKPRGKLILSRHVHISRTREEALEEASEYMPQIWRSGIHQAGGFAEDVAGEFNFDISWEQLARERAIIGTVDDVIREVGEYESEFQPDQIVLYFVDPRASHDDYLATIRLVGREVIQAKD